MLTYTDLTKQQKIELITHLRTERVRLLTESRRKKAKRSNSKKKQKLPNLQFKSPELQKLFENMTNEERKKLLG